MIREFVVDRPLVQVREGHLPFADALAIVPVELGWVEAEVALPPWSYGAGVAGLALAGWILWATRRREGEGGADSASG